jgi:hypothetical protein
MPYVRILVPKSELDSDASLGRIVHRIRLGKNPQADLVALTNRLGVELKLELQATATST